MKNIIIALSIASLFAACKSDASESEVDASSTVAETEQPSTDLSTMTPVETPQDPQAQDGMQAAPAGQAAPAQANVKDPNPKHGAPGHRCDIPEGASLSMPVQQAPTQQAPQQIQPQAAPKQAMPQAGVSDPNPKHGAPGHRCDIPEGASLSTPVQSAPTQG